MSAETLDESVLAAIAEAMASARRPGVLAREALTSLASVLPAGTGLTIDFKAATVLGQPLVVLRPSGQQDPCFADLTPREREVAGLLAVGLRNKDIALALAISVATVKDHVHRVLTKSGLDSRAAVAAAWREPAR